MLIQINTNMMIIAQDSRSEFLFTDGSIGRNANIFGAEMNSSLHVGNEGKDNLILGEGPTQGLNDAIISKAKYPINFTH